MRGSPAKCKFFFFEVGKETERTIESRDKSLQMKAIRDLCSQGIPARYRSLFLGNCESDLSKIAWTNTFGLSNLYRATFQKTTEH